MASHGDCTARDLNQVFRQHEPEKGEHPTATRTKTVPLPVSSLATINVPLPISRSITDTATFHCQQAAEKHLKAFLVAHGVPFDRVHNLVYLLDLCVEVDARLRCLAGQAALLTPYAVMSRYPGSMPEPLPDSAEEAYAAALKIVEAVKRRLEA